MTKTTDNRQIGLLIQGVLGKYAIDNLQLEIDLTTAVKRYFDERNKSGDKADIRERILQDMNVAESNAQEREKMQTRVKAVLGFDVSGSRFDGMIDWLIQEDREGKTIEKFRAWWDNENEYKRPALWKISDRPAFLSELWPSAQAFAASEPEKDMYPTL